MRNRITEDKRRIPLPEFSVSYGIAETRNGDIRGGQTQILLFSYYKVRIYGDRVVSSDLPGEGVNLILGRFKTTLVHLLYFDQIFSSQT